MFNLIDGFYNPNELGLIILNIMNLHFMPIHQSHQNYFGGNRLLGYPTHDTKKLANEGPLSPYSIFIKTWKEKTNIEPLYIETFFRKTKLSECKESPSWKQYKQHQDGEHFDVAGLIYFNSNSLKDGTYIYNTEYDYEPTVIIGSKYNRCVWYSSQQWHSPTMEQSVEERWTQPFFIIYKEETFKKFKDKNAT
jgi:hypothetical protein